MKSACTIAERQQALAFNTGNRHLFSNIFHFNPVVFFVGIAVSYGLATLHDVA